MRRLTTPWLLLLASCGAHISNDPAALGADAGVPLDAAAPGVDAPATPPDAAPLGPWSTPATVTVAATTAVEDDVTLSSNALEMVYAITDANSGKKDLYYTSRTAIGAPWSTPPSKLPFDTAASEETPRFSVDDKTLYFASDRTTAGNLDIWAVSHTAGGTTPWGKAALLTPFNTDLTEKWLSPCSDGHYVIVQAASGGDSHLFEGKLGGAAPVAIDALNATTGSDTGAFLTPDCLTLYFASFRATPEKIFVAQRATVNAPWGMPAPVDTFKIPGGNGNQEDPWLSPDGRTFVFASDAAGTKDVYISTR
ncbi:MAG TPA: hypothetical protein VHW23_31390 [Kofleriaceae bacterium]|jgi:Tol biopolymer transport system component|nr:hypothetical protein [Kofleriaceae bacterium]